MKTGIATVVILFLFTSVANAQLWNKAIAKRNKQLPGQTAPYDMVFVPGKGNIPSFYMSVAEEPNINYVIYLKWLLYTYVDYPDVIYAALPHYAEDTVVNQVNGPFLTQYLMNPAYAYYSVVGLSWQQVQDYLLWKTDRLNEAILCKTKQLIFYPEGSTNENNYTTDAYLNGQYEGYQVTPKKDSLTFQDGILFTGFRLPTEAEWEYARHLELPLPPKQIKRKHPAFSHPFGEGYFTLAWLKRYEGVKKEPYYLHNSFGDKKNYNATFIKNPYKADPGQYEQAWHETWNLQDSVFRCIYDYPCNAYGLFNISGGVKEWVLDAYTPQVQSGNWLEVMRNGGFNIINPLKFDTDGNIAEKDSLGRMHNCHSTGVDAMGFPKYVSVHPDPAGPYQRVVKGGTWNKPGYYRMSLHQDSASQDVGFRCILPYSGAPVAKGYKVNWDRKMKLPKNIAPHPKRGFLKRNKKSGVPQSK